MGVMVSLVGWVHISFILKNFPNICGILVLSYVQFSSVIQSCPTLCDPWTATWQASLSITNFQNLFRLMSVMPSNHLILWSKAIVIPWRKAWQPPVFLPGESPWTWESGGLQCMGSQRVRHDWETKHTGVVIKPPHSVQFSRSVVSDSSQLHESQHARPPGPSPTPEVHSDSHPSSQMPSSHLILHCPLLLLPPIPPSIKVFSNESTLCMRWPKYWSFSFSIIPSKEIPGLISFRMDWLDLLAIQGTLKSLL